MLHQPQTTFELANDIDTTTYQLHTFSHILLVTYLLIYGHGTMMVVTLVHT